MILLSSLMLLVAGVTVVACVTAIACIQTVAGILLLLEMKTEPFPLQSIHDILSDLVTQLFNLFESLSVNCGP